MNDSSFGLSTDMRNSFDTNLHQLKTYSLKRRRKVRTNGTYLKL